MREKDPYIYDIPESNLCWLHNCGSAAKSTLQWLKRDYDGLRKMDENKLKANEKPAFVLLHEPEYSWWTGVIEWGTCFDDYAWFKKFENSGCFNYAAYHFWKYKRSNNYDCGKSFGYDFS